jgi:pimeloyl-ACP methyl ester carboxylesterase
VFPEPQWRMPDRPGRFLAQLRRRHVYRAAVAYVMVGLGVLGAAEVILDPLGLGAVRRTVVVVVLMGFPVALIGAWTYQIRSDEPPGTEADGIARASGADSAAGTASITPEIQFCTTADGVRLAYSVVGAGPPLVRVLGWFTHLEAEWQWPELRSFWESLAEDFTLIRYDGRGIGLSDPWPADFTEETRLLDVGAVLDAANVGSAALLGISEGGWTAASYALQNPDRVSALIFYGCYSRGLVARPGFDPEEDEAMMTLVRKGWGRDHPSFRQVFSSDFFSLDADPRLLANFDELQRRATDGDTAFRYLMSVHHGRGDGQEMFERVRTRSLVLHQRLDRVVKFEEGRRLAALIPGAQFQPLSGSDHYFPLDRESAREVAAHIARFVHGGAKDTDDREAIIDSGPERDAPTADAGPPTEK